MKLTDIKVRGLKAKEKLYRVGDGDKLYLQIDINNSKIWQVRLARNKKDTYLSIGNYPAVSLAEARLKRNKINEQIAEGKDPVQERFLNKISEQSDKLTFNGLFVEWFERKKHLVCFE